MDAGKISVKLVRESKRYSICFMDGAYFYSRHYFNFATIYKLRPALLLQKGSRAKRFKRKSLLFFNNLPTAVKSLTTGNL